MMDEVKGLLDAQMRTFEEMKAASAELHKQVESQGAEDDVTREKLEALNKHYSNLEAKLEKVDRELVDVQTKMQRPGGSAGGSEAEIKAAEAFGREVGTTITVDEFRAYKQALNTYMRRGKATPEIELRAMSVGSDPDGGYSVTPDMTGRIVARVYETSPMRQMSNVVQIGTDALEGFADLDEAGSGWVGETQARPDTDTPGLGKWSIPVHEVYAQPKATQKLLDDSQFDIEAWLAQKIADRFAREENAAFVVGDGVLKPRGITTYTTATTKDATRAWGTFQHVATGASGAWPSTTPEDKLIDLVFAMKDHYLPGCRWLMNRSVMADVRKMRDGEGNLIWSPDIERRSGTLLVGYPVTVAEDMPDVSANALAVAFGNFAEAYQVVDRVGIRVLRDPYTQKGFVKFYSTRRVGGGAVDFEAVKFLKFA